MHETHNRWRFRVLDRATRAEILTTTKFDARGTFGLGQIAHANITIPTPCFKESVIASPLGITEDISAGFEWTGVRSRGHWGHLVNLSYPHLSLLGPLDSVTYDLALENESIQIRLVDWMQEFLEQILFAEISATDHTHEIARLLMVAADIDTPARVRIFSAGESTFTIDAVKHQTVRDWWRTLTLAGMIWRVQNDLLILGTDGSLVDLTPDDWEDRGVQISFDEVWTQVLLDARDDLTAVAPGETYTPEGFYPKIPVRVAEPNVNDQELANSIARGVLAKSSSGKPNVRSVGSFLQSWPESMPGQRVRLTADLSDSATLKLTSLIDETNWEIEGGVEVDRTIRLRQEDTEAEPPA